MGKFLYKLPELGEGIHEGEIVSWLINVGETIEEDQPIAEIQNDKSIVELPSPVDGKVSEIKFSAGETCTVEDVILVIDVEGQNEAPTTDCGVGSQINKNVSETRLLTKSTSGDKSSVEMNPNTSSNSLNIGEKRMYLATPSVRKFARELDVPLIEVKGTGKNGRITREDVLAFVSSTTTEDIEKGKTEELPPSISETNHVVMEQQEEVREPLKGIRKVISNAMVQSKHTAAHVTIMDEIDVTELVQLRKKANELMAEQKGMKLTYLPFFTKVLIAACRQFPIMNASIDDTKDEIVYKKYFNIGIATDTDKGLIVPVVKAADKKSIWEIGEEIDSLASRGREGKLTANELKGSTITITNIGSAGGMIFTPIINYPEVAILGTGRIKEKPIVKNGEITIAPILNISVSFDHRLIDGATAQNFINYMKQLLENPQLLITEI